MERLEHNLKDKNRTGKIRRQLEIWNIALKIGTQLEKLE